MSPLGKKSNTPLQPAAFLTPTPGRTLCDIWVNSHWAANTHSKLSFPLATITYSTHTHTRACMYKVTVFLRDIGMCKFLERREWFGAPD